MSAAENKKLLRRFYEEVCNQQRFELLDQLLAENYEHHNPSLPPEMQHGRAAFGQILRMFYGAFPDLQGTVETLIGEGDKVVARIRFRGTHRGELMGVPASGNPVDFSVIEIYRIANGQMVEGWAALDVLGVMQQIGAMPAPQATT
jgi:steroid delta-isomerase-like uncharacterized protein